ncbi:hypothetical protein LTR86_008676 [Recurvomyces mirabilis]|nr:hypothetical protein LTR86_008676 [Recurvomyces mirabilis]
MDLMQVSLRAQNSQVDGRVASQGSRDAMSNNTTIAAPISWTPSAYWDGNDGLWNTFTVGVGTPPQNFRILPSTAGQEAWLPNPEGCATANPANPGYCGSLRGALPYQGSNSSGFANNESSSWNLIGLYTLDAQEAGLGYEGNGLYGFDTVMLNGTNEAVSQTRQVVASVPDLDYWLGYFGLGPKTINFTTFNQPIPNFMSNLVSSHQIPSLSWGYTAGAHYRNQSPASLTLGGYDTSRFTPSYISFSMDADNSRPLQVGVQGAIAEGALGGAGVNLWQTPTYHFIDSTLPHIWLPSDTCDAFVAAFGLTYDNTTDLFLINSTMRQKWLNDRPTVTFVLANTTVVGGPTQTIELPYAAFDMQASYPYYQNATNYFPIRRAANDSQYTIGRAFLQEAYLIADHERNNFTVAPTTFDKLDDPHLVAIHKPTNTSSDSSSDVGGNGNKDSQSLSGGAIGGIAVGVIAIIALLGLAIWFFTRRRNKTKHQPSPTSDPEKPADYLADKKDGTQIHGTELDSQQNLYEVPGGMARHPSELPSPAAATEVEGDMGKMRGRPGMYEMPGSGQGSGILEAPGSDGVRHELYGSSPARSLS